MTLPWASYRNRTTVVSARWNHISKTLTQMNQDGITGLLGVIRTATYFSQVEVEAVSACLCGTEDV